MISKDMPYYGSFFRIWQKGNKLSWGMPGSKRGKLYDIKKHIQITNLMLRYRIESNH